MDDEDGRCLLDVICDPQALNDFLHGSEKIDGDDLLDSTGDAASAFFEGAGVRTFSFHHLFLGLFVRNSSFPSISQVGELAPITSIENAPRRSPKT
nr:glioma tumor suppressor candidate region gene 1 protein-like [Columba livia]